MADGSAHLDALLTKQHDVYTQLQPCQQKLLDLASKLKDMALEGIHTEINASFNSAKQKHDAAIDQEQKVTCTAAFSSSMLTTG